MDLRELKKILSGLGMASLLAGATLMATGCATSGKSS
jgi:radical SAM modification target selenobiotic family peptide